jgi:hypothetical protein
VEMLTLIVGLCCVAFINPIGVLIVGECILLRMYHE